jgi:hypothetical protein
MTGKRTTDRGNLPVPPCPFHWSASRTGATRRRDTVFLERRGEVIT